MSTPAVYYVGTMQEVEHHARPLAEVLPLRIETAERVAELARPGDLALFYSEHFDRFRYAIDVLQQKQVATLYAIDGILEWCNAWVYRPDEPACPWTMRPVLSHKVACIGPSQARMLASWGNGRKLEVVGIPRFDTLVRAWRDRGEHRSLAGGERSQHEPARTNKSHPGADVSSAPFRLLIMTAKWPGFTREHRAAIHRALRDIQVWIDRHPQVNGRPIEPVWRVTGELDRELGIENQLRDTTGADLAEVLSTVDAVITTPSTTQLESMLAGKPTAVVDYTNSPVYVDAAWRISAADYVGSVIEELMFPPANKLHFQDTMLQDALRVDGSATERMANLVHAMLRTASDQLSAGQPLCFESIEPLVDWPSLAVGALDPASAFPDQPEFTQLDTMRLQAQLAHARREIRHLQRLLEDREQELAQAHEIFEQIHRHPIAGPIVRTRQKLIDWMDRLRKRTGESAQATPASPTSHSAGQSSESQGGSSSPDRTNPPKEGGAGAIEHQNDKTNLRVPTNTEIE